MQDGLTLTLPGTFDIPTQQIGRAVSRITRPPARMIAGALGVAGAAYLTNYGLQQGYSAQEQVVFNNPGAEIEGRIQDIWNYTNSLIEQYPLQASPGMIANAMEAEAAMRNFGVESFRETGSLYTHGYNAQAQQPFNDLWGSQQSSVQAAMRSSAEGRDLLRAYSDYHGIAPSDLPSDKIQEVLTSEDPMSIAPEIEAERPEPIPAEQAIALVATDPDGRVRITGAPPPQLPCRVLPYGQLQGSCGPGRQAHHIIPDYTKRYGTRDQGALGQNRIPGLPGFREGMAICLTGHARSSTGQHGIAHRTTDPLIAAQGMTGTTPGTTTLLNAAGAGAAGAIAARPECATVIAAAVTQEIAGSRPSQLVNANPLGPPVGPARTALMAGR